MGKDLKGKELGKGIGQSKDKRYYARFTDRLGHRSKPYYSFDLKEVKDWLLKQRYEDKLGKDVIFHENVTIGEVYKLWYEERKKKVRPHTINTTYYIYQKHIKPYEFYKITSIDQIFVNNFMDSLINKGISLGYIISIKSIFSQMIEYAIENKMCSENPFSRYKFPKTIKDKDNKHKQELKESKFLTLKQQEIFLNYINTVKRCNLKNFYKFMLYTGLRVSEAIAFKWEQFDYEDKSIYIKDNHIRYYDEKRERHILYDAPPKSNSSIAKLPLSKLALLLFEELLKNTPKEKQKGLIFLNDKGLPLKYINVYKNLTSLVKTINKKLDASNQLPPVTPHYFRHTFAENYIVQGMHLTGVQYMMRHAKLTTTANAYGHTSFDVAKEALNNVETNINNKIGTKLAQSNFK